jgi:hypothetical protein
MPRLLLRLGALVTIGLLLSVPVLGADDEEKKPAAKKNDADKTEIKKDESAKKDKEEPAKKDAKKDEAGKKDADKKDADKKMPLPKMPPPHEAKLKNLERDPAKATEKAMKSPTVTATIMAVVEEKKSLRLQLTIPYLKINTSEVQAYNQEYLRMLQAQNPQTMLQHRQNMLSHQANMYQIATTQKEVEWQATDDVKVRMKNPPPQFDDKGRIKRYTAKELKELKGNEKLPGYPAEFSDIKTGQIVQVTLLQKKESVRPRRGKDADVLGENLPTMSLIVIFAEPKN